MRRPSLLAAVPIALLCETLALERAEAGCGFYAPPATASASVVINDADQVTLMREGTKVALTMSTNYKGPTEDFAMVVPVPVVLKPEAVKTLSPEIFHHLETLTAPRIVEYDELDPCFVPKPQAPGGSPEGAFQTGAGGGGGKGGGYGVKVEAAFITGEYQIVVLSASESDGLERWLKDNHYKIPDGTSAALAPYVTAQQKFVVAKVDATKVKKNAAGEVVLSPLRFVYESNDFRLPVRLGLLNAPKGGKQDLIVYLLARGRRMESVNYPNVFVPTNVDVDAQVMEKLGPFYAALFDATLEKAGKRAVVTEYAWSAEGCGAPCTTTGLAEEELGKLGGDELLAKDAATSELVLTRLHTRYDAATLNEDIVFRTADPIAGGREGDPGAEREKQTVDGALGFQVKYAVRHAWSGPMTCATPKRGVWIARSGGLQPPALGIAGATREVALTTMVKSPITALGLATTAPSYGAIAAIDKPPSPTSNLDGAKRAKGDESTPTTFGAMELAVGAALVLGVGAMAWVVMRKRAK